MRSRPFAILHLSCSPNGESSRSWKGGLSCIVELHKQHRDTDLVCRRVILSPPYLFDADYAATVNQNTTPDLVRDTPAVADPEDLIAEFEACDVTVVVTPMQDYAQFPQCSKPGSIRSCALDGRFARSGTAAPDA